MATLIRARAAAPALALFSCVIGACGGGGDSGGGGTSTNNGAPGAAPAPRSISYSGICLPAGRSRSG
jgi:hypothetical protein